MPEAMKSFIPSLAHSDNFFLKMLVDRHFWILLSLLIILPLCLLRRLDSLRFTSVVALIAMSYLIFLVLWYFIKSHKTLHQIDMTPPNFVSFASNLPIFVFAFTCHQNVSSFSSLALRCSVYV